MVIRVQDTFQELPGVRRGRVDNPLDGPNALKIVGEQSKNIGRAVQSAGGVAADIVREEQEKANKIRLNDVYNEASSIAHALRYDQKEGYLTLKGGDAVRGVAGDDGTNRPITTEYGYRLDKRLADLRAKLGNDVLAERFDVLASDLRTKFENDAVSYEAEQASVYAVQVQDATVINSGNELAASPFGPSSAFHIMRARDAAVGKARAAGLDGEALEIAVQATLGKMHTAVIDSMLDAKDATGAKAYYEQYKDQFGALDAKAVGSKLETAYAAGEAIQTVDQVIAAHPLILNQSANKADMDAALRAHYGDNVEGLKAARAELSQRISDHEFQENEANAAGTSAIWKRAQAGESLASLESSRAWLALPGDKQASLREAIKRQREGTDMTPQALGEWATLMGNTEFLRNASPAMLAAFEPQFGQALTKQLFTAAQNAKAAAAGAVAKAQLDAPTIPEPIMKSAASQFVKGVYGDKWGDDTRAEYGAFMRDMWSAVAQEQAATGKVILPAEMESFILRTAARHPNWGNLGGAADTLRAAGEAFGQKELAALGVFDPSSLVGGKVARYLAQRGMPPTIENARRAYLDVMESGAYLVDE